jgi:beta-lactamase class A
MASLSRRVFFGGCAAAPSLLAQSSLAQSSPVRSGNATLSRQIANLLDRYEGKLWLYAKNLDTGAEFGLRPDERVRTASTIKLPILCALFDLVGAGKVRWDEKLTLREADKISGSGVLHEFFDGTQLAVRDVAHVMIVVSDNTATNLILDRITADAVNDYLDRIGLRSTRALRKVRGDGADLKPPSGLSKASLLPENKPYGLGVTTPREMVTLLEMIERGKIVSPEASREIVAILKRQQYKGGIGRRRGDDVASKSGSLDALRSDVGIVYLPTSRLAIAATVDDMPKVDYSPDNAGEILIADVTERLVAELG